MMAFRRTEGEIRAVGVLLAVMLLRKWWEQGRDASRTVKSHEKS